MPVGLVVVQRASNSEIYVDMRGNTEYKRYQVEVRELDSSMTASTQLDGYPRETVNSQLTIRGLPSGKWLSARRFRSGADPVIFQNA